jgi:hypothetical protein
MNSLSKALAVIFFLGVTVWFGFPAIYHWLYPTYAVRYRLTVNVIIEGQRRSGSSVRQISVKMQPNLLDNPPWALRTQGEATFVDLENGRKLIAPLSPGRNKGSSSINIVFRAFHIPFMSENASALKDLRGERTLDPADWPGFVTFPDVQNALSVEPVNPFALDAIFGEGARVESVTLAITEDDVTRDLNEKLPWLNDSLGLEQIAPLAKRGFGWTDFRN